MYNSDSGSFIKTVTLGFVTMILIPVTVTYLQGVVNRETLPEEREWVVVWIHNDGANIRKQPKLNEKNIICEAPGSSELTIDLSHPRKDRRGHFWFKTTYCLEKDGWIRDTQIPSILNSERI